MQDAGRFSSENLKLFMKLDDDYDDDDDDDYDMFPNLCQLAKTKSDCCTRELVGCASSGGDEFRLRHAPEKQSLAFMFLPKSKTRVFFFGCH